MSDAPSVRIARTRHRADRLRRRAHLRPRRVRSFGARISSRGLRRRAARLVATPIVAEGEHTVVLGIGGDTDYVDTAYRRLLAQCPGEIIGVNTRFSTSLRFFYYQDRVHIQALCVR